MSNKKCNKHPSENSCHIKWTFRSPRTDLDRQCEEILPGYRATYNSVAGNKNTACLDLSEFDIAYEFARRHWPGRLVDRLIDIEPWFFVFYKSYQIKTDARVWRRLYPRLRANIGRISAASSQFLLTMLDWIVSSSQLSKGHGLRAVLNLALLHKEVKTQAFEHNVSGTLGSHFMQALRSRISFLYARCFSDRHDDPIQELLGAVVFSATRSAPAVPVRYSNEKLVQVLYRPAELDCVFDWDDSWDHPTVPTRFDVQRSLATRNTTEFVRLFTSIIRGRFLECCGYSAGSFIDEILRGMIIFAVGKDHIQLTTNYHNMIKLPFGGSVSIAAQHSEVLCLWHDIFEFLQYSGVPFIGQFWTFWESSSPPKEHLLDGSRVLRKLILHIIFASSLEVLSLFVAAEREHITDGHIKNQEVFATWFGGGADETNLKLYRQLFAAQLLVLYCLKSAHDGEENGRFEWDLDDYEYATFYSGNDAGVRICLPLP
ncbi:hypothetical protein LTR84_005972 [Exophiala bonariae]|uniref:Transcription factor domain-containing protein n=1 Tax=Exophiala bonariae TaxID=1690606 RepID=A0AAV9N2H0_9EURO|nr:hypothetical protein LTR84_005972 [Exophiala bonariae]